MSLTNDTNSTKWMKFFYFNKMDVYFEYTSSRVVTTNLKDCLHIFPAASYCMPAAGEKAAARGCPFIEIYFFEKVEKF
jgi:hypothetical protein